MKRLYLGMLLALAVSSGPAMSAGAQLAGEIHGVVSGPNGPLNGLTVNTINGYGSVVGTAVTSSTGAYTVPNLAVGTYTIQLVDKAGAVLATGKAAVTATASAATANLTISPSLSPAALTGSRKAAYVLAAAAAVAVGTFVIIATRSDSSPTR